MAHKAIGLAVAMAITLLPGISMADDDFTVFGGDTYASGQTPKLDDPSPRSVFVSGFSPSIDASVAKDAHIAGGHVSIDAPIAGDVYAAGFWVSIDGPVSGDVSASGYSVSLGKAADVGGNTRVASRSLDIDGNLSGSLLAVAQNVTINGEISGDVLVAIDHLTFGPDAKINGSLVYLGPRDADIPASVIDPDRVIHKRIAGRAITTLAELTAAGETLNKLKDGKAVKTAVEVTAAKKAVQVTAVALSGHEQKSFWTELADFIAALVINLIVVALLFWLMPRRTELTRARLQDRPLGSLGYGFIAMAALIGVVPVAALTIVGIVLIPFFILFAVIVCYIAYLLAAYALAWWALNAIKPVPQTFVNRLLATAAGLALFSLLHYVPYVGWIANIAITFLGLGAVFALAGLHMLTRRERPSAEVIATPPPAPPAGTTDPMNPPDEPPRA